MVGLRERKKQRTIEAICQTAITLMLERGFDSVSVTEIAEAAEVSKMTVFNYFPTKEDIVLSQIENHAEEAATVVRTRPSEESPLGALRRHFLEQVTVGDPFVGVSSDERVLAFTRLVVETPSLMLRYTDQQLRAQHALTAALVEIPDTDELTAAMAAAQIVNVQRTLSGRNLARILDGASPARVRRTGITEANTAFDLLERGLETTSVARPPTRKASYLR